MGTSRLLLLGVALAAAPSPSVFEDDSIRLRLPAAWSVEGLAGEYLLHSDEQDAASLLLLLSDFDGPLAGRLAEIEHQFLETGIIELEAAESRRMEGVDILYRRYRLRMGSSPAGEGELILLHQYSFERAGVPVLLQVETVPGRDSQEELFRSVFGSLEIHAVPDSFRFEDVEEN